ncbi:helix-turn-helix domain-containing protein [Streptomyces sp. RTd22]|uniref:nSTAND1 domain-containing NTPase n=1 Tax=Streptomyces sp. RTd22 TaxID=1841249 RepID=UPI0007C43A2B|nr:helix-turn-helix domain-containing protein [Streptomyces sp. RTd22]
MGRKEKPLDPSAGPVQGFAYELRKLRQEAGGPAYRAMAQRVRYSAATLSQAAAGDQLPSLPVVLAYAEACGADAAEWEERWRAVRREVSGLPREDDDAEPPYQGLTRFEIGDHERFFGREQLVSEALALVRGHGFAAVFGPSGSGKSSLLRAGLIPALRAATREDPGGGQEPRPAVVRVLTPGDRPLRTHAEALVPKAGDGETWLVVDQFEELFTLCHDPAERAAFVARLLAARDPGSRLRVVIGVRADFFDRCAEHRELTYALRDATLLVGPMSRAELRAAIVKPAAADGLIVERALTARIVEEVVDEPGGLPLMSHALLETWRRRRRRALTVEMYEAVGGLHGAIAKTAERVYEELNASQAETARRILLRLITPGEGAQDTRHPVDRGAWEPESADTAVVLERLVRARLITLDRNTVDLAHEALITAWPRLRGWIEEDRERLRIHRKLTEAARAWQETGRDPGALYRGVRLTAAVEAFGDQDHTAELSRVEREFLAASRTFGVRERRRLRTFVGALSLLVVLALVAGVVAWQQNRANERRGAEAAARRIAAVAENMRFSDPVRAMRLSVAAWRLSRTAETRSSLLGAMVQKERRSFRIPVPGAASEDVSLSADGRFLVVVGRDRVRRWDVLTQKLSGVPFTVGKDEMVLHTSPDGRRLLATRGQRLQLWNLASGKRDGGPFGSVDDFPEFGPSGRTLLTVQGSSAVLRDLRYRHVVSRSDGGASSGSAVAGDDDRNLVLCPKKGPITLWDVVKGRKRKGDWEHGTTEGSCENYPSGISLDRDRLAVLDGRGIRIWDVATGKEGHRVRAAGLEDFTFSADGRFLAAATSGEILLWRVASAGAPVFRYALVNELADALRIDTARGEIRYLGGADSSNPVVRTISVQDAVKPGWRRESIVDAAFSPDGRVLGTATRSGEKVRFRLVRGADGTRVAGLPSAPCRRNGDAGGCAVLVRFSPDGRAFAFGAVPRDDDDSSVGTERVTLRGLRSPHGKRSVALTGEADDSGIPPLHSDSEDVRSATDTVLPGPGGEYLLAYRQNKGQLERWEARGPGGGKGKIIARGGDGDVLYSHNDRWGTGMALRPDGRLLATAYGRVFALPSGRATSISLGQDLLTTLEFSGDGRFLAAGGMSGRVSLWDGDVEHRLGDLAGTYTGASRETSEAVTALAFSPDGGTLAVAGDGGTVQLWDVASQQPLGAALPSPGDGVLALAFGDDGKTLLVAGRHASLQRYAVDPPRAVSAVCRRAGGGLSRADWKTYLPEIPYRDIC